jgi:hypothetical protein
MTAGKVDALSFIFFSFNIPALTASLYLAQTTLTGGFTVQQLLWPRQTHTSSANFEQK